MTLNHTDHILGFLLSESSKVQLCKDGSAPTNPSLKAVHYAVVFSLISRHSVELGDNSVSSHFWRTKSQIHPFTRSFHLIPPPSLGGRQALVVTKPLAVCSYPAGALRFQPVNIPGSVLALLRLS
ncbi:hypothetical protein JOQ06_007717 [Pogonophryne albipinna]|uniref:Uncharacterized protein n=1 Tax=Pogonophryne albipinna TaxID=1090488 RepID=A0AAD6B187_9TELE|nr:hypothetical protein JOQ06_007717 [Pogonophryne albipinna]